MMPWWVVLAIAVGYFCAGYLYGHDWSKKP